MTCGGSCSHPPPPNPGGAGDENAPPTKTRERPGGMAAPSGRGNGPPANGRCAFVREEMGLMRGKTIRGAWLLAFGLALALAPGQTRAQDATGYAPADPQIPLPLGSTRPEDG